MSRCIKCKGCYWVEHTYMPGVKFSTRCPSNVWNDFDSYGAFGKMRIGHAMVEGKLDWTPTLLEIVYADPLCGACDVGCKRNLDLEIELSLEAMRVKAVQDGAGPMPAHKKIAENIATTHNLFGAAHADRKKWVTPDIKVAEKADLLYFVGCTASYTNKEIAQATAKILNATKTPFMLMPDEWCCGNTLQSVGMLDEARELAKRNIEMVKSTGAKTVLLSCAEGYRMWKVEYPKLLNIATADLPFKVVHLVGIRRRGAQEGRPQADEAGERAPDLPRFLQHQPAGRSLDTVERRARLDGNRQPAPEETARHQGALCPAEKCHCRHSRSQVCRDDPDPRKRFLLRGRTRNKRGLPNTGFLLSKTPVGRGEGNRSRSPGFCMPLVQKQLLAGRQRRRQCREGDGLL